MANNAAAGSDDLFQRKATGLLRGWSVWDGFIYAAFSINLITLGLLAFSYAPFIPDGSLILAIILAGLYLVFQTVTYASLIAVMPRAGGDYVWTSRVLGGGIGFVLAVTGWWFILWHWVPIYADLLNKEVFVPLAAILGLDGVAHLLQPGPPGLFTSSHDRRDRGLAVRLARHEGLRPHPEVLLLRRARGARGHDRDPALQFTFGLRRRPTIAEPRTSSARGATPTRRPYRPVRKRAAYRPATPSIRPCS